MRRIATRIGRLLLAGIFVHGGWHAANEPGGRPAQAAKIGLPEDESLIRLNGAAMMAGGIALGLDVFPRMAALGLIASLALTTADGHRFWEEKDPAGRRRQETQFLKNAGLLGGLVLSLTQPS